MEILFRHLDLAEVWYFVDLDRENQNVRRTALSNARKQLTTNMLLVFRYNQIGADQIST
jgi:hypothetical protein